MSDPRVIDIAPHLRKLCSNGEYQLEVHWARKVCCCKTHEEGGYLAFHVFSGAILADLNVEANEMLLTFPYRENYVDLVRMEMNAIASVRPGFATRSFAVLGSGPLPLTSLCISRHFKSECVTCHNVDQDAMAVTTAVTLCRALGYSPETMCFQCASAGSPDIDMGCFDIVYLAALVGGCSSRKHEIIADVVKRMKPGALVVMRSAHSLRRLLYPVRTVRTSTYRQHLLTLLIGSGGHRGHGIDWAQTLVGRTSLQSYHQFGCHSCRRVSRWLPSMITATHEIDAASPLYSNSLRQDA